MVYLTAPIVTWGVALLVIITTGLLINVLLPKATSNSHNWLVRAISSFRAAWRHRQIDIIISVVALVFLAGAALGSLSLNRDVLVPLDGAIDADDLGGATVGSLLHLTLDFAVNNPEDWAFWIAFLVGSQVRSPLIAWLLLAASASNFFWDWPVV